MSENDKIKDPKNSKADEDDLDDLDDYLDDFADEILSKPPGHGLDQQNDTITASTTSETGTVKDSKADGTNGVSEEDQITDLLKQLEKESPEAKKQFESLLNDATTLKNTVPEKANGKPKEDPQLKDTIASTLERLKQSGAKVDKSIEEEQPDKLLSDLLNQLNMDGEGGLGDLGDFDMAKMLTDMLDNLASKEVLYGPLSELASKYPAWIEEHQASLPPNELESYQNQYNIVKSIVDKFEEEDYSDSSKPHREFISEKLEEMQKSGNPPEELMGDMEKTGLPGFNFNNEDIPEDLDKELEQNCAQS